jgi:hypothetical protein
MSGEKPKPITVSQDEVQTDIFEPSKTLCLMAHIEALFYLIGLGVLSSAIRTATSGTRMSGITLTSRKQTEHQKQS